MAKYRKKPIEVEAMQLKKLTGEYVLKCMIFMGEAHPLKECDQRYFDTYVKKVQNDGGLKIKTLEGTMIASARDYIIKGVNGEFYPCKPDIFEKTYEQVK